MRQCRLHRPFVGLVLGLIGTLCVGQTTDSPLDTTVKLEQVRRAVDESIELAGKRAESRVIQEDGFLRAADRIVAIGTDAIPLLASELETGDAETFFLSAYALGRLGTPAAVEALREAITSQERTEGQGALFRKAWACYGLSLAGDPTAAERVNAGRHAAGKVALLDRMSVLEAIASQHGQPTFDALVAQHDRFETSSPLDRLDTLKALGRFNFAGAIPILSRALEDDAPAIRRQGLLSLAAYDRDDARALIVDGLSDPVQGVRLAAAEMLANAPDALAPAIAERLQLETDTRVRRALYRALARGTHEKTPAILTDAWGRSDPFDRAALVEVLPWIAFPDAASIAIRALDDEHIHVSVAGARALAQMQPEGWEALLMAKIDSPKWNLAQTSIDLLVGHSIEAAAPLFAKRLLDTELVGTIQDPRRFHSIIRLGDALIELRTTGHLPRLAAATGRQTDPTLQGDLGKQIDQLEALAKHGNDSAAWRAETGSEHEHLRLLAYRELARLGGAENARAMTAAFTRSPVEEGVEILRAFGAMDHQVSHAMLRRVLVSPEFDVAEYADLRAMAAWSARRIGGPAMGTLLAESVERRRGRDLAPLIYLGVLEGRDALETLTRLGQQRMRDFAWDRANEMRALERLSGLILRGGSLEEFDLPPELLRF